MGTERHRSSKDPYFATRERFDVTRQEQPPSSADSSLSGSTQDPDDTEGIKRHNGIPTIAISDPEDDRSPETSPFKSTDDSIAGPRFDLYGRTLSPSRHARDGFSCSKITSLKKKTYHVLSLGHEKGSDKGGLLKTPLTDRLSSGSPIWKRRAASMPFSKLQKRTQWDVLHHTDPVAPGHYLAPGSPPIVDFTKFEDRYRSPSSDYDSMLSVSEGKNKRKALSLFSSNRSGKPDNVFANKAWKTAKQGIITDNGFGMGMGIDEMVRNSSDRSVLYPATERKPDPRLIMDAIANASEVVDTREQLNVEDLSRTYDADQEDFEVRAREAETGRKSKSGKTRSEFLPFGHDLHMNDYRDSGIRGIHSECVQICVYEYNPWRKGVHFADRRSPLR